MNENINTELLIRYMDGELTEPETGDLEKNLDASVSLRKELEALQFARAATQSYGLKTRIGSIHRDMMHEFTVSKTVQSPVKRMVLAYVLRAAAVLIMLVGVSALYQYLTATSSKLFQENFRPFALHETRGALWGSLKEEYKTGNMDSVIILFNSLQTPTPEDYFFTGIALLETNQAPKAIETFQSLIKKNDSLKTDAFQEDAEYYLGMSYLANDEAAKALPVFQKIKADPDHVYNRAVDQWFLTKVKRAAR